MRSALLAVLPTSLGDEAADVAAGTVISKAHSCTFLLDVFSGFVRELGAKFATFGTTLSEPVAAMFVRTGTTCGS